MSPKKLPGIFLCMLGCIQKGGRHLIGMENMGKQQIRLWFTNKEEQHIFEHMQEIYRKDRTYYMQAYIWDCVGDFVLELCMNREDYIHNHILEKELLILTWENGKFESDYYTAEVLIKLVSKLEDWKVLIKYKGDEGKI